MWISHGDGDASLRVTNYPQKGHAQGYVTLCFRRNVTRWRHSYNNTHLTAFHQDSLGKVPCWILMKQQMTGLQWHQVDHVHLAPDR